MTKTQENEALNYAKQHIQDKFKEQLGFAPSKNLIIPLEAGYNYDPDLDLYYCDFLGFRVGSIGYSYRIGEPVEPYDAYNA